MKASIGAALLSAFALAACGGGGGSSSTETSAEGFYEGTTGDNREIVGAILPNGTYYVLYTGSNNPGAIGGFVQGTGTANNGSFSSSNGTDFSFEGHGVNPVTVSASYRTKQSLSGTVSSGSDSNTFTSTYSAEYEKTPSLETIAGTYSGIVQDAFGSGGATITMATNGTVTGATSTGCDLSGTIEPAAQGNAYAVGLTFSGSGCGIAGLSVGGAAFYDSVERVVYSAVFDAGRSYGAVFLGSKP
jgi:hypothetical protein